MALDAKKWLMEELGFSAEEADALSPKFTAERLGKIETSVGLLSANAAAQREIEANRAELQRANDQLSREMAEWATLTQSEKNQATELQAALEASRVRATQLETRLTNLATQHGVDPKSLLEGTTPVPEVPVKRQPAADEPRYVPMDAFSTVANFNLDLAGALTYIAQEHQELTGKRLDTREIVSEIKARSQKQGATVDPIAIWEEKYGIPKIRTDRETAARAEEIRLAEERGAQRVRTEIEMPGPTPPGRHSVVFGRRDQAGTVTQPRTSVLSRPQPQTTVQNAVAALRSGKYRQQPATTVGR